MFGRQMEMERIMDFLMQKEHLGTESVRVLPIVGPTFVGKSTLVAHVYNDPRVRNYFSRIMVISGDDINNENLVSLKDAGVIIHQNNAMGENERVLAIIKFSGDVDEVAWNNLYSCFSVYLGRGSRMLITSRSNKVMKFGTTPALVLNHLP
jgi:ABC-type phosphate/phosphonate transport system ATPase subunit